MDGLPAIRAVVDRRADRRRAIRGLTVALLCPRMRLLIVLLSLLAASAASAQRNVAYFELGGSAVVPSVNYERQLSERWFGRVGFSIVTGEDGDEDDDVTMVFPVTASYLTHPAGNHHLEAGGGVTFITGDSQDLFDEDDDQISNLAVTAILGYRYQRPRRGFVFRAGVTPVFHDAELLPWAGLSFGYRW